MTRKISAKEAQAQFAEIMTRVVEQGDCFLVGREDETEVIVMSVNDYLKLIAPEHPALTAMRDEAKRVGLDTITMEEIDEEIAAYRREKRAAQVSV